MSTALKGVERPARRTTVPAAVPRRAPASRFARARLPSPKLLPMFAAHAWRGPVISRERSVSLSVMPDYQYCGLTNVC